MSSLLPCLLSSTLSSTPTSMPIVSRSFTATDSPMHPSTCQKQNVTCDMWISESICESSNSTNASSEWTYFTCAPCWTPNATQTCKQSCFGDQCKQSCFNNTKVVNHLVNIMGLASTWSAKWQCDMWHVNLWVTSTPKRNHPSEAPSSCVPSQHRRSPTSQMQSAATT